VIDAFVRSAISSGIDTVINLGAGMDTRPYRMDLPSSLHWIEVDYPILIEGKTAHLSTEVPACSIERFGLDLADRVARRELFDRIWTTSKRAMVLTEGASVTSAWTRRVALPTIYMLSPAASGG
jgi:O-methyltransferase involved in polyketide biosynthesis